MAMKLLKFIVISIVTLLLFSFIKGNQANSNLLFKIERSKDANQVLYVVNTNDSNQLNEEKPITIYWIKNTKKGKIESLTWIQRKYAYGLKYSHTCDKYATFNFVSYDKMFFTLKKIKDQYKVYTMIDKKLAEVERIFVQIDGGTFWFPDVTEVKIFAKEVKNGNEVIKIINP